MSVTFLRSCSVAALTIFSAQGAWADVSGKDVWADWKAYVEGSGYTFTANEVQSGDTLTVSDLTMEIAIPEEDATVNVKLPTLTLVDNGDGSVNASFPAAASIDFDVTGGPEDIKGELTLRTDGTPVVVTGDPDDMTYVYDTEMMEIGFGSLSISGEELPPEVFSALVKLSGVKSSTHAKLGENRSYDQTYDIANLVYDFAFQDPENAESKGAFKANLNDLSFTGTSLIPMEFDATNLKAMLEAGSAFDGNFTFGSGQSEMSFNDGSENFQFNSSSTGGKLGFAMSADELKYNLLQAESDISVVASELPFPIAFSVAEIGMALQMPPVVSEDDKDMALAITLRDFNVPETLWAIADPTGALPHDPASIVLDLSGKGRLLFDILDPEAAAEAEYAGESPAEVNSVKINELLLRAAGAELTGTGAFEIDYNDLDSFDGMPAPLGVANLSLIGANGLIDNLIKMGIMSDSDATGARLMMGLLAVPGEGDDSLVSEIEFSAGGQISANGQRIK